jgi:hypothetical protein
VEEADLINAKEVKEKYPEIVEEFYKERMTHFGN